MLDQVRSGRKLLPVRAIETFLAVRHQGAQNERQHTWIQFGRQILEDYLQDRPLYERRPETLLPAWALKAYREIHQELLSNQDDPAHRDKPLARDDLARHDGPVRRAQDGGVQPQLAKDKVLILTPLKDAADYIAGYCERLLGLTYPHDRISVGFMEGDSTDNTYEMIRGRLQGLSAAFGRARLWKKDYGYQVPPGIHRGAPPIQVERRTVLAKSRNQLLFHALDNEDWVLWLDVDVIEYPPDLIERLLATGKDIVQPHCVLEYGGATFDLNGWRDQGRLHLDALRGGDELVELHAVGGTVLLVRADAHREGLIFPAFLYGRENPRARKFRGELETEGLGIMAHDMGYKCWGMPNLEVIHQGE